MVTGTISTVIGKAYIQKECRNSTLRGAIKLQRSDEKMTKSQQANSFWYAPVILVSLYRWFVWIRVGGANL